MQKRTLVVTQAAIEAAAAAQTEAETRAAPQHSRSMAGMGRIRTCQCSSTVTTWVASNVISHVSPDDPVRHEVSALPSTAHSGPLFGKLRTGSSGARTQTQTHRHRHRRTDIETHE
jgi:hypothetical protein